MWRRITRADRFGRRVRSAYTLIEMLIAAVLVAALMSVVYGMMSMYNSYLTAGQSQAVEQQLIRSVLQMLEQDLLNVAIPDTNPQITPAVDMTDEVSSAATDFTGSFADPFAVSLSESVDGPSLFSGFGATGNTDLPGRISLAGNSSSFRLSIERMVNEVQSVDATMATEGTATEGMATEGTAPKVPEFQSIIWQFQAPGVILSGSQSLRSGLYRIQGDSLALQTALLQQNSLLEESAPDDGASVDQMTMEALLFPPVDSRSQTVTAEASGSQTVVAAPQFDLIPEVVGCRFEYFSGSAWSSSWSSDQQNGLPVAVRVRLRLVTPSNLERLNQSLGATSSPDSLLENAIANASSATSTPTPSNPQASEEAGADPIRMIPTRQVERIILLQPISSPMPQPGTIEESNSLPGQVSVGWDQRLISRAGPPMAACIRRQRSSRGATTGDSLGRKSQDVNSFRSKSRGATAGANSGLEIDIRKNLTWRFCRRAATWTDLGPVTSDLRPRLSNVVASQLSCSWLMNWKSRMGLHDSDLDRPSTPLPLTLPSPPNRLRRSCHVPARATPQTIWGRGDNFRAGTAS